MDLMEVMGMSLVEVVEWALAHEFEEDELDCGDEDYYEEHLEEKDFDGELTKKDLEKLLGEDIEGMDI